jgi:hypothetical protein
VIQLVADADDAEASTETNSAPASRILNIVRDIAYLLATAPNSHLVM